jgi:hypothetical protein
MMVRTTAVALILVLLAGCREEKGFLASPNSTEVTWQALQGPLSNPPSDQFRLAITEKTQGVFPAAIAVARVVRPDDPAVDTSTFALSMKPEVDFLAWNSVFDDFRTISDVFPLNTKSLDGAAPSTPAIIASGRALKAKLCLIYAESQVAPTQAAIRGVLFEVASARPLAEIHARGCVDEPLLLSPDDQRGTLPRDWETRVPLLVARRRFELLTRQCLLALMANDEPMPTVRPEGWVPDRPLEPAVWPPVNEEALRRLLRRD